MMKKQKCHVLALPYPSQGHVNPMLQFCKRLSFKGIKTTLAPTIFIFNTTPPSSSSSSSSVQIEPISDGYDEEGFAKSESINAYLTRFKEAGSKSLAQLITKYQNSPNPIDCIVYDPFMPWALEVGKQFGLVGAAFFTQACAVNYIYYSAHHGLLKLPVSPNLPVSLPGLPLLHLQDMPSFICVVGSYPAYFQLVLNQFSDSHKADFILVNTFYGLEQEAVDSMSKICPLLTIGPTIPSMYLDKRIQDDNKYGFDLFTPDSTNCTNWLQTKPPGSVIYVSFGSMANLSEAQRIELAWGLKATNYYFLWVIKTLEEKLPKEFIKETTSNGKGLLMKWCPQIQVLSNPAIGCFFTHCGWNSTSEALSLGVPMIAMPQWTDQTTNSKLVQDVWKVGIRVKVDDESGIVKSEEIESCIRQVMEGEKGIEMKENARKWKELAKEAVSEGGSSDRNIDRFLSALTTVS